MSEEAIAKTLISLMLKGKIHTAVRFDTLRGAGGVLLPNEINLKSGGPVIGILFQKHLVPIIPTVKVIEYYNVVPEFVPLNVTEDTVELITWKFTGIVGPGRSNAVSLQQ